MMSMFERIHSYIKSPDSVQIVQESFTFLALGSIFDIYGWALTK